MPVVHVRSLGSDAERAPAALVAVAEAVAAAVPCRLEGVWCTFQPLGAEAVGARIVESAEGRIVYVDVWMRERDDPAASTRALEAACMAAAGGLGVPVEDVWGTFRPVADGRVFAGGALVA